MSEIESLLEQRHAASRAATSAPDNADFYFYTARWWRLCADIRVAAGLCFTHELQRADYYESLLLAAEAESLPTTRTRGARL